MTYQLFIGSHNDTKELELGKIELIVHRYFEGFTIVNSTGYWRDQRESAVIVAIETKDKNKVLDLVKDLKLGLSQESIGLQKLPSIAFV